MNPRALVAAVVIYSLALAAGTGAWVNQQSAERAAQARAEEAKIVGLTKRVCRSVDAIHFGSDQRRSLVAQYIGSSLERGIGPDGRPLTAAQQKALEAEVKTAFAPAPDVPDCETK